jgi:hypothetical protein
VLRKYDVDFFKCSICGFIQTEEPYWLKEAYLQPINISDTGYLQRNITLSKLAAMVITCFSNHSKKFLDYAGGYGVFVRLMRDLGFDFYWQDKYTQNLFAKGFEYNGNDNIELITAFECVEHFADPLVEFRNMLNISQNLLFTTEILPEPVKKPEEWWYYGLEHGQHISFYTIKTLSVIANKHNLHLNSSHNVHLLTTQKINPYMFKIMSKLNRLGLFHLIKKNMKSKTVSDMYEIANNI